MGVTESGSSTDSVMDPNTKANGETIPNQDQNGHPTSGNSVHATYGTVNSTSKDEQTSKPDDTDKDAMSEKRKYILLSVMAFVDFIGSVIFSMIGPFYPQFASDRGAGPFAIGAVVGSFELAVVISSPIWGIYMPKLGVRNVYIGGIVSTSICASLFGVLYFIPEDHLYLFINMGILLRFLMGVSNGAYCTGTYAIAVYTMPHKVASILGILELSNGLGILLGPIVGSALFQVGGFFVPFATVGIILLIIGISIIRIIPNYQSHDGRGSTYLILKLLTVPMLVLCLIFQVCNSAILATANTVLALHLNSFQLEPIVIGLIFLAAPIAFIIGAPLLGIISDRLPGASNGIVIFMYSGAALSLMLLGPAPFFNIPGGKLWLIIVSLLMYGGFASALVVAISLLFTYAKEGGFPDTLETYGKVSGLLRSFAAIGAFLGAMLGGLVYGKIGFGWMCVGYAIQVTAIVILFSIGVSVRRWKRQNRPADEAPLTESIETREIVE